MPAAEMYMFICVHFFTTRKLQRADQRAESKKNAYTIYILNIHFLYSKSAYTIYTPETTFPAGSSTSNGPVTTLPPRKFAGSRQKQDKLPPTTTALPPHTHTHILRAAELSIQRSKAKPPARPQQHGKKIHAHPAAGIYIFFRPFFPLPSKWQTGSIHPTGEEKREKGV